MYLESSEMYAPWKPGAGEAEYLNSERNRYIALKNGTEISRVPMLY
jgi:hypothetical protein